MKACPALGVANACFCRDRDTLVKVADSLALVCNFDGICWLEVGLVPESSVGPLGMEQREIKTQQLCEQSPCSVGAPVLVQG